MMSVILDRRRFLQLATVSPLVLASVARPGQSNDLSTPLDHGIGGTGQSISGETDHGIGGTGVFGTIQRFGSIFVNGNRIAYSPDVLVNIDGVRADQRALRLGQVVRVALNGSPDHPSAHAIYVTSEVIGPIESMSTDSIVVLSQTIELTPHTYRPALKPGEIVAVYGIRKPDGTIVASRIEKRVAKSRMLLRGVAQSHNGHVKVGNLIIDIAARSFVGHRVVAEFGRKRGVLRVKSLKLEDLVPGLREGTINVETYVERAGETVSVGVGVTLNAAGFPGSADNGHTFVNMSLQEGRLVSPQLQDGQMPQPPNIDGPPTTSPGRPDPSGHESGPGSDGPKGPPK
ncbi:DUF5666 domain-containing protein [Rhizobium sp. P44RR-XXIV]|uniref:DUF5666 domain-containing protein n=1 Tax=Rhizobium sp. P44RR-XXIV TaxID=1921145 RepID=UPI0010AA037F|nr:DUF5666 domain-containing protein [Rhizobium sp. P44RR-XXIV]TIX90760.1 hypothetical protein BSK43_016035 [Rhizobium sp. P44RR-XXIV]